MPLRFLYILFLCVVLLASCKGKKSEDNAEILAEYQGHFLYKSDIPDNILNKADSGAALKAIIDKWLENTVLVSEAEKTLSEEQKDKEKLIEDYRNSLLIYEYQQQLIREKLDTGVTEAEIESFYNNSKAAFQLKKNIVKIRYIKINRQKPELAKLKKLMQTPGKENDASIKAIAEEKAENFYLDSNWLYLDDIIKEIPLNENYNQQRFLANNRFISIEEGDMLYLVYILDFRIKDAASPLEFEKDRIKDILLYQRKLRFLKDNQKLLTEKALKSGEVKYYHNKK